MDHENPMEIADGSGYAAPFHNSENQGDNSS
jgi:hypothetical protein